MTEVERHVIKLVTQVLKDDGYTFVAIIIINITQCMSDMRLLNNE